MTDLCQECAPEEWHDLPHEVHEGDEHCGGCSPNNDSYAAMRDAEEDEFDADAFAQKMADAVAEGADTEEVPDIEIPQSQSLALRECGVYIAGVYNLSFRVGVDKVKAFDVAQPSPGVALVRVLYRNGKERFFVTSPASVVVEMERAPDIVVASSIPEIEVAKR